MSKICRTCLQKTEVAFGVNQLHEFGENIVKISYVLRFCMPELYLGLSTNPEICYDCKRELETAYLFKRKCLNTEMLLGNYLKTVRCTGKSIELYEVLSYMNDQTSDNSKESVVNAQDIINEWEDSPDGEESNSLDLPLVEVRQSAPNPLASLSGMEPLCPISNYEEPLEVSRYIFNSKKYLPVLRESVNKTYSRTNEEPAKTNDVDIENDFPKITSVFSLSNVEEPTNAVDEQPGNDSDNSPADIHNADDLKEVKTEPIDIEHNGIDYSYQSTDEETLDASETASYDNMQCDSDLQGIIDSIPVINDSSQYVDVPEFVQINNFGPRELEQLRQRQLQVPANNLEMKKVDYTGTRPPEPVVDASVLKSMLVAENSKVKNNAVQDKTFESGDKVISKHGSGYRVVENDPLAWTLSPLEKPSNSSPKTVDLSKLRKKLKLKPVEYKFTKTDRKNILADRGEDKTVVVLFTNYTLDGRYVNDHDYLLNPYRRNKILVQCDGVWFCMCYICNYRHKMNYHIRHMNIHSSVCKICDVDMGTPFMLNGHVRSHEQTCNFCKERLSYGLIDFHQCYNKKPDTNVRIRRRRFWKDVEKIGQNKQHQENKKEPIPVPEKQETETTSVAITATIEAKKPMQMDIKKEESVRMDIKVEEPSPKKRGRKRKIKIEECSPSEMTCRVLRSMPRKWYSETDVDSGLSCSLEDVSNSIDPP